MKTDFTKFGTLLTKEEALNTRGGSCNPDGAICSVDYECCSGICINGVCGYYGTDYGSPCYSTTGNCHGICAFFVDHTPYLGTCTVMGNWCVCVQN